MRTVRQIEARCINDQRAIAFLERAELAERIQRQTLKSDSRNN